MNRKFRMLTLIFLCTFAGYTAEAQHGDFLINRVEDRHFSRQNVTSISQDLNGFIWFGTESGLFRYDAHTIIPFQSDAEDPGSLPGNSVQDIYKDPQGELWVIIELEGLSLYNPIDRTFQTFYPESDNTDLESDVPIGFLSIHGDANPYLWLVPDNGKEIYRFDTVN